MVAGILWTSMLLGCVASSVAACATTTNTSRGGNPDRRTTEVGPGAATGSGGSGGSATNGGVGGLGGSGAEPDTGPPSPACDWVELQPQVCATRIGDWADGGSQTIPGGAETTLEGTVTDVLLGSPPCSNGYPNYEGTWYARISDGVRGLEMAFPTASPIVKVGDVLSVFLMRSQPNGFAPLQSYTEVRTSDHRLLFWQAASGSIATLQTLPEVRVTAGAVLCEGTDESNCGSWETLLTEMASAGISVSLRPGGKAHIGEYAVAAGGIASQVTHMSRCTDWYVAIASVMAVRTTLTNLMP